MIWGLLVIMQFKHFIADYPLQGSYMLGKFKDKGWVLPLSAHCAVHFLFTLLIAIFCGINLKLAIMISCIDFTIHFIMDRIKASPKMLGRFESLSKEQFRGLLESRSLAMSGTKVNFSQDLVNESKRLVETIDKKFKSNVLFWWSLGLDQMVHHLTDILVVYLIISNL